MPVPEDGPLRSIDLGPRTDDLGQRSRPAAPAATAPAADAGVLQSLMSAGSQSVMEFLAQPAAN